MKLQCNYTEQNAKQARPTIYIQFTITTGCSVALPFAPAALNEENEGSIERSLNSDLARPALTLWINCALGEVQEGEREKAPKLIGLNRALDLL